MLIDNNVEDVEQLMLKLLIIKEKVVKEKKEVRKKREKKINKIMLFNYLNEFFFLNFLFFFKVFLSLLNGFWRRTAFTKKKNFY
jgi:hypothetical protein